MRNLASGYVCAIESEFGGSVNVMGISTSGSIAQQFAIDFSHLVRKLVLGATAYIGWDLKVKKNFSLNLLINLPRKVSDAARVFFPAVFAESSFSQCLLGWMLWLVELVFLDLLTLMI